MMCVLCTLRARFCCSAILRPQTGELPPRTHASPRHRHRLHDRRIIGAFACPVHTPIDGPFPQRAFRRRLQHLRAGRTVEPDLEIGPPVAIG